MQKVYALIQKAAQTKGSIAITGETGTGKTTCAQAVHFYSDQNKNPFFVVSHYSDVAKIILKQKNGTVFFKKIFEQPEHLQRRIQTLKKL